MQVACSRCRTRYKIPSEKLEAGPIKVRCKECDHIFGVRKKKSAQDVEAAAAVAAAAASEAPPVAEEEAPASEAPQEESPQAEEEAAPEPEAQPEGQPEEQPEKQSEELISDAGFGDGFGFDDMEVKGSDETAADELQDGDQGEDSTGSEEEGLDEKAADSDQDEFGFGSLDFSGAEEAATDEPEPTEEPQTEEAQPDKMEFDLSDFDSSVFDSDDAEATISVEGKDAEPELEDLFDNEPEPEAEAPSEEASTEDSDAGAGGFDLGTYGDAAGSDFFSGNQPDSFSDTESDSFSVNEPMSEALEQVDIDDLLTHPALEESESEQAAPRLDLRKGDRRAEGLATPAAAPKKKSSSVVWSLLLAVILGTAAFVGYNALVQPDKAFYFLNPDTVVKWLNKVQGKNILKLTEPVEGAYLDRPEKDKLYVISGWITNTSSTAKNAIEVTGAIFGVAGDKVAEATSYCGNVISQEDLMVLGDKEIAERLSSKAGDDPTRLDVERGSKAPFMVVFVAPPPGVGKFTVEVTGSSEAAKPSAQPKAGSGKKAEKK